MQLSWRKVGGISAAALLAVLPILVLMTLLLKEWSMGQFAPDFRLGLYPQIRGLLDHGVAFDPPGTPVTGQNRIYTVFTTLLLSPLGLLPVAVAQIVMTILIIASVFGALAVLGVRDYRVYSAVALWPPFVSSIQTANVTGLLVLAAAFAWRFRDREVVSGAAVGFAAAMKVFMWPLGLWLLARRRLRPIAAAGAVVAVSLLVIVPFGNPIDYFRTAQAVARAFRPQAFSVYVLLGRTPDARIAWLIVALIAAALVFVARRDHLRFAAAIAACVLFSPIVWLHYFTLMVVPLAARQPRFGPLWLVPLVYWAVPFGRPQPWQIVLALAAMTLVLFAQPLRSKRYHPAGHPATS